MVVPNAIYINWLGGKCPRFLVMGHAIVTYAQQAYFVRKYPIFIILYHGPPM